MSRNEMTANTEEMEANQQAYSNEAVQEIRITNKGKTYNKKQKIPDDEKVEKIMKTDVDSILQTTNDITGINTAAYNVYSGNNTKADCVVVGVAGSQDANDWIQNFQKDREYRSINSGKRDEQLLSDSQSDMERLLEAQANKENFSDVEIAMLKTKVAENMYEFEMRRKVEALKKYQNEKIPIILTGDSKGGEDAAYLAIKSQKAGIEIEHLHLTNPKGIRVSEEDYKILEKMAEKGKITKEIVYPEMLSSIILLDGTTEGNDYVGRVIPGKPIYTVPNGLNMIENHTISNYEDDVYQGVGSNFKFQCDEKPEEILKKHSIAGLRPSSYEECIGYRYKVSRVTDRAGNTISVTDYFFEEQKDLLNTAIIEKLNTLLKKLDDFKQEDILTYFTEKARSIHVSLEDKHKAIIKAATPFSTFKSDHKDRFDGEKDPDLIEAIKKELETEYNNALKAHVESESVYYPSAVSGVVSSYITKYQETIAERAKQLTKELERVQQVISSIEKSKIEYKNSQKEIQLIIEKMM